MGPLSRILAISLLCSATALAQFSPPFGFWKTAGGGGPGGTPTYSGKVQSGDFWIYAWTSSNTAGITTVDSTKAFNIISYYGDVAESRYILSDVQFSDSATLEFTRGDGGDNYTVYGRYYAASDTGLSVQRKSMTIADDSLTRNVSISTVDTTKSFVILYAKGYGSTGWYDFSYWRPYLFAGNIRFERVATGDNGQTLHAQVVTYDSCTVQQRVVTMAGGVTSSNTSITAVDTNKTFILCYPTGQYIGNVSDVNVSAQMTSTTNLNLLRDGSTASITVTVYVVTFTDGSTVQKGVVNLTDDTEADTTISTVAEDRTFLVGNGIYLSGGRTAATGYAQGEAQTKIYFEDAATVRAIRWGSSSQTRVRFYAVTLGGLK